LRATPSPDPALRSALAHGLERSPRPEAEALARFIVDAFGSSTLAVIHYGSRAHDSGAEPESAHDFFVIVERYGPGRTLAEVSEAWRPYRTWAAVHLRALREQRTGEIAGR